jgi:mutual gliding-motility protein MglA
LRQADAIVFVADSQMDRQNDNLQALQNLETSLRQNGSSIESLPMVIQYNKRDLPNAAPVEYLEFLLNNRQTRCVSFEAEAARGRNVLATLNAVSTMLLNQFHQRLVKEHQEMQQGSSGSSSSERHIQPRGTGNNTADQPELVA